MKYFAVFLAVLLASQSTQAFDLRECLMVVLQGIEDVAGQIIGFGDWYDRVVWSIDNLDSQRNQVCPALARDPTNPSFIERTRITACRAQAIVEFTNQVQQLGNELFELTGGSVEIVAQFVEGMARCVSNAD